MFRQFTDRVCYFVKSKAFCKVLLAALWCLGFLLGFLLAARVPAYSLMRTLRLERVSIVGLAAGAFFPLICSAVAVRLSMPLLFLPLAFLKAAHFSFNSFLLLNAYASAGWLVRWLYLFSDSFMVIVLFWFWLRNLEGKTDNFRKDFLICCMIAFFLVLFDYFIVSPITVMLFNYL